VESRQQLVVVDPEHLQHVEFGLEEVERVGVPLDLIARAMLGCPLSVNLPDMCFADGLLLPNSPQLLSDRCELRD
jgi:hypothetical protein